MGPMPPTTGDLAPENSFWRRLHKTNGKEASSGHETDARGLGFKDGFKERATLGVNRPVIMIGFYV